MSNHPNYHGFLHNFAPKMDKVLDKFRTESTREDIKSNWFLDLMLLMVKDLKKFYKPISKIGNMKVANLTSLPLIGGVLAATSSWFLQLHWMWLLVIGITVFILSLLCLIPSYKDKMLNIYHPYFHLPAYKRFRPIEFELLNHSVLDKHFSYTGLTQYVNSVLTRQHEDSKVVEIITQQYNEQKEEYKNRIQILEEKEMEIVNKYKSEVETLNDEVEWSETVVTYLVEFIQEIYVIMHRIASGAFDYSDLKLISGFTIFQKESNGLRRIADIGTTGQTPSFIYLNKIYHNPWVQTVVDAARGKKNMELRNNQPREGYEVVSFRFYLGKSKKTWIFSLQIHESTNPRASQLALSDDIIDKTVMYEMLYGLCMILDNKLEEEKQMKGAGTNDSTKTNE
ncbi:hypothetical protein FS935_21175 [Metabacillus litoralis]|uniref:Uncharacterized protein n=1 Tax=Metabacillus litoralis TaxID=152268 RepID=A0A5C6VB86_9BACI|nr:hypothetical protein [Metabacillus litoralis]TXC82210.1 hypothetical protein FS935_21175 [Metabacillus litoralis]